MIRDVALNYVVGQFRRGLLSSSGHKDTRQYGVTPPQDRNFATRSSDKHEYQKWKFSKHFFASFPYFNLPFTLVYYVLSRK